MQGFKPVGFPLETLQPPSGKHYDSTDLKIIKTYRFEGDSDPTDSSVIYLLKAKDGLIGYSPHSFGAYSDYDAEEGYVDFIRQIPVTERAEEEIF